MYITKPKNIKLILRDTAIIVLLMFVGSLLAGIAGAVLSLSEALTTIIAYFGAVILGIIGFTNAGGSNPRHRWKHLLIVALCVWVAQLHYLFFGVKFTAWLSHVILILFIMVLGGVIAARSEG